MKDKFTDVFGHNPKNNHTMQVIVFDKFFKCMYRLRDVPADWGFREVGEALKLTHPLNQYQAIRLSDNDQFCTEEYVYKDNMLKLTTSNCE